MTETINFTLTETPTELYKILKFEGIASSGAEAKMMIDNGLVKVNDQLETRKRRKIVTGDIIVINNIQLIISA